MCCNICYAISKKQLKEIYFEGRIRSVLSVRLGRSSQEFHLCGSDSDPNAHTISINIAHNVHIFNIRYAFNFVWIMKYFAVNDANSADHIVQSVLNFNRITVTSTTPHALSDLSKQSIVRYNSNLHRYAIPAPLSRRTWEVVFNPLYLGVTWLASSVLPYF